jgi:hypothetical protein
MKCSEEDLSPENNKSRIRWSQIRDLEKPIELTERQKESLGKIYSYLVLLGSSRIDTNVPVSSQ